MGQPRIRRPHAAKAKADTPGDSRKSIPENSLKVPLRGSERKAVSGSRIRGKLDPEEKIQITIVLRPRQPSREGSLVQKLASQLPRKRKYLTRSEFAKKFGSTREELVRVTEFARDNSLSVVEMSSARRSVFLSGTVGQLSEIFGTTLRPYEHPVLGSYRGRIGSVQIPRDLEPLVSAVLGLDNRPQARAHIRFHPSTSAGESYTPPEIAQFYDYPSTFDGANQSVGIIELGGGFSQTDVENYSSNLGISPPSVTAVSVDGATNSPTGNTNGPDGEVLLDIELIGTIAPKVQIFVYFAPNTDAGFVDAVSTAIHDTKNKPAVLSISWGNAESEWTSQAIQALDQAIQDASTLGVTVCVASGDDGSSDGVSDGLAHTDFPASSPYAIGCGGTRISVSNDEITSQVTWDDLPKGGATGGGVSDVFPLPSWQSSAGVPSSANPGSKVGRGVPDVSGDADPETGYTILVDGSEITVGGTSAVAPLWTGLLALVNQSIGKPVGYINPLLYSAPARSAFRDVVLGNNGAYKAGPGWDACTGWGSPDGTKVVGVLSQGGVAPTKTA